MGSGCRQRVSDVYWSHKVEYKCPESMKKIGQQVVYMEMLDLFVDPKPGLGAPPPFFNPLLVTAQKADQGQINLTNSFVQMNFLPYIL